MYLSSISLPSSLLSLPLSGHKRTGRVWLIKRSPPLSLVEWSNPGTCNIEIVRNQPASHRALLEHKHFWPKWFLWEEVHSIHSLRASFSVMSLSSFSFCFCYSACQGKGGWRKLLHFPVSTSFFPGWGEGGRDVQITVQDTLIYIDFMYACMKGKRKKMWLGSQPSVMT